MYRVLIADDHPVVRRGLKGILEEMKTGVKVSEAGNGREAIEMVATNEFDIVLLDVSMPGMGGIETLRELKKIKPSLPVLMLSVYPEEDYAVRAMKTGASGYLTKKSAAEELVRAMQRIMKGHRYISSSLADILAVNVNVTEKPLHEVLSNREFQVMEKIVNGRSLKEIASELAVSPKTVSTYRSRILEKMQLKSNAELIQYTLRHRIFS